MTSASILAISQSVRNFRKTVFLRRDVTFPKAAASIMRNTDANNLLKREKSQLYNSIF
jgi:hypothetical protein